MNKNPSNRILSMQSTPLFETTVEFGEFTETVPDWDRKIQVKIQYYDGRETITYVEDRIELEVMNLYLQRNRELWQDDESYD